MYQRCINGKDHVYQVLTESAGFNILNRRVGFARHGHAGRNGPNVLPQPKLGSNVLPQLGSSGPARRRGRADGTFASNEAAGLNLERVLQSTVGGQNKSQSASSPADVCSSPWSTRLFSHSCTCPTQHRVMRLVPCVLQVSDKRLACVFHAIPPRLCHILDTTALDLHPVLDTSATDYYYSHASYYYLHTSHYYSHTSYYYFHTSNFSYCISTPL